ncbi:tetratricopeptide repeat protein [Azospirillum sp. TSO22-1]|uniref:O-linked N-acetylglucosamine transferase family protein n=1 Tax=Azospirillum sp. TSO22-1 TaxID=716789 RepID=UPI000D643CDB|nr:tetratricopeptide repeat protein [Azospirillum sp. TSO22-1]
MTTTDAAAATLRTILEAAQAGRPAEAAAQAGALIAARPDHAGARVVLGVLRFQAGDPDAARRLVEGAAALDPGRAETLVKLAALRRAAGDRAAAVLLPRARRLAPDDAAAAFELASLRQQEGAPAEAAALYRLAVSLAPAHAAAWYDLGLALQSTGRSEAAVAAYARVRALDPARADAANNMGLALVILQRGEAALAALDDALARAPTLGVAHRNRGDALCLLCRIGAARDAYHRALALDPADAEAMNGLGMLAQGEDRFAEAAAHYRRVLAVAPGYAPAWINLGAAEQSQGRPDEAERCQRAALGHAPGSPEALCNLGMLLVERGDLDAGIAHLRQAVARKADYADAFNNLGIALQRKGDLEGALEALARAARNGTEHAAAYNNLGAVLLDLARWEQAAAAFASALAIDPALGAAFSNRGNALKDLDRYEDACASYRRALVAVPDLSDAANNLGVTLQLQGRIDEAIAFLRLGLTLDPDREDTRSNLLLSLNYSAAVTPEELAEEHREYGRRHGRAAGPAPVPADATGRRLRVGYVSADFRSHSVARFLEPLLLNHDRGRVEVFCYANVTRPDGLTARLQGLADHWRNIVGRSDAEAADMVRADGIDALIDLSGHTGGQRLGIFAGRAAPVQATWLGYPNSSGLPAMDLRFTDALTDPPGAADALHAERLVRIDGGFLCYQPPAAAPDEGEPPRLDAGHPTFGSFNNLAKMSDAALAAWGEILRRVPDARLVLKHLGLRCARTREHVLARLARAGIDTARVDLQRWRDGEAEHLAVYRDVDVALDSFPYNGTTTTFEALWMGVPVVTLAGDRHAARVGLSILEPLGLGEMVAADAADYVERAVALARAPERLSELRRTLRRRLCHSTLTDGPGFARRFEAALFDGVATLRAERLAAIPTAPAETPAMSPTPTASAAPTDERSRLEAAVAAVPFWYHRVALPHGVTTPGFAPLAPAAHRLPERLDGLRVLDVGTWDGYWAFEALRRGAAEVVAIDDLSDRLGLPGQETERSWQGFDLCRAALGYGEDRCRRLQASVYSLDPAVVGTFDLVLLFGTLNQCRHPLLALDTLATVCTGQILVEAGILDRYSPYCGGVGQGYDGGHMIAEFYPTAQYGYNPANWWAPTLDCLANMLQSAGFGEVEAWPLTDHPTELAQCRGFARARRARA